MENPYATPESDVQVTLPSTMLLRRKKIVIAPVNCQWPERCFKCNQKTSLSKPLKLKYASPLMFFQKKFRVDLPLCQTHLNRHKYFVYTQLILSVLTCGSVYLAINYNLFSLMTIGMLLFLASTFIMEINRLTRIVKLKDEKIWLRGAGADFLDSLKEYFND